MGHTVKVHAHDGIVSVEPSIYSHKLIGATCQTTLRTDFLTSKPFRFIPSKGNLNDLVLVGITYSNKMELSLFHILKGDKNKKGFVTAAQDPVDVRCMVGADVNYQVHEHWIELRIGDTVFTSNGHAIGPEGSKLFVTDASSILKFIAGHIKLKELRASVTRTLKRTSLEQELATAKKDLVSLGHEHERLQREKDQLQNRIHELAEPR